jgi:hypothetical protein
VGLVAALGFSLVSCATMSPEECKVADWRAVGLRDGLDGRALSRLGDRSEDCAKVGVVVNTQTYLAGRDSGLKSYCRIENAVPLGLNGGSYAGVCPPAIDSVFQQRFQTARAVYDLRSEVKGLDDRIESLERRLRGIHQEEEKRMKEATSEEERRKIRKAMDDERDDVRADLGEADRRLRRKRDELRSAEFSLNALR